MQPDDRFQVQFAQTVAGILAWSGFVRDWAVVSYADERRSFSFAMQPVLPSCCPVALVLFRDAQTFSITLGQESYEDLPVTSLDLFPRLLEAISDSVVERHHLSRATGLPVAIEMRIGPLSAPLLARTRRFLPAAPDSGGEVEWRDRHFLPYRRVGAVPRPVTRK